MQPTTHSPSHDSHDRVIETGPRSEPGIADNVQQLLVWLDGLRDRRAFSTVVPMLVGGGLALLWVIGQSSQPAPIDGEIPSILERAPTTASSVVGDSSDAERSTTDPAPAAGGVWVDGLTTTTSRMLMVVHVSGAVARQGLVELADGSRLADAIDAAGGETELADVHRLNLATPVVDGMHIRVPVLGAADDVSLPLLEFPTTSGASNGANSDLSVGRSGDGKTTVNVNRATEAQLIDLPGVGPATAAAIIAWRNDNGPFATIDDLLAVPGIGPAKLSAMESRVAL